MGATNVYVKPFTYLSKAQTGIKWTTVPCYINRHNIWIIGGQFACIVWKYDALTANEY